MHHVVGTGVLCGLMVALVSVAQAGPERVQYPVNYKTAFVRYATVDKRDRQPPAIRSMYVNPDAVADAKPGQPLPAGTIIVMEEHVALVDESGEVVWDRDGRFIPTEEVTNVFVAEKRAGWGEAYPEALRNGDWEFAVFLADGSRKSAVEFETCRECHKQAERTDFTFSLFPKLDDLKG